MTDFVAEAQKYLILIEGGPPTNYSAWSPDVLGCVATGQTVEEVKREMREALALHLKGMVEDGLPLPEPSVSGSYLAA
jgi:predicted RNase H-like HicB family nuclease